MKDFKLKFTNKEECYSILEEYVQDESLLGKNNITILDIGIVYDANPLSTEEVPLESIPRDGYYVLVRDMNIKTLFSISAEYITEDIVPFSFGGKLPVPEIVTNGQFRDALVLSGISLSDVSAAIQAIPDPIHRQLALNRWDFGNSIERNHPLIIAMAPQFGLTEDSIDEVFRLANSLN